MFDPEYILLQVSHRFSGLTLFFVSVVFLVLVPRVAASLPASSSLLQLLPADGLGALSQFQARPPIVVAGITRAVIRVSLGLSAALGQVCAIISSSNKPDLTLLQT
jgi:hypothetical protein